MATQAGEATARAQMARAGERGREGHAVLASFLGWTLDAFDFFVLVFVVPAVASEFQRPIAHIAYAITVTLAFRPVGAFIFGWMADRYGRRIPLMVDVIFYSIMEVASGLAPTYGSFLLFRALYGIGMGGEWGVGASLAMEAVPARWRGLFSGLLQEGYAVGYLLAAAAYFLVFPSWGWRPLFFLGGLPALLAFYIRSHVPESKAWAHHRPDTRAIIGAIIGKWKTFLYLVALMTMMNLISHGTQDLYPTFLGRQRGLDAHAVATIAIIYNLGALAGGLVFGLLSDRFGRKRAMSAAVVMALAVVPLWIYPGALWALTLGAFLMQFMVQGAWGVVPAHLTELSPPQVRGLFPGFAYQIGVLLASSVAYLEAVLATRMEYSNALALVAVSVLSVGVIVILMGHERSGADFHQDG